MLLLLCLSKLLSKQIYVFFRNFFTADFGRHFSPTADIRSSKQPPQPFLRVSLFHGGYFLFNWFSGNVNVSCCFFILFLNTKHLKYFVERLLDSIFPKAFIFLRHFFTADFGRHFSPRQTYDLRSNHPNPFRVFHGNGNFKGMEVLLYSERNVQVKIFKNKINLLLGEKVTFFP